MQKIVSQRGTEPRATSFGTPGDIISECPGDFIGIRRGLSGDVRGINLEPAQVMMCAADSGDLAAAQALGLKTGHIGRPGEGGPGTGETEPKGSFDVVGKNFHDFADKLGV
jgi:2-haloacid dehalogenase